MQRERERLTLLEERCEITEEGGLPQGGGETQGGGKCEWVNDSIVPLRNILLLPLPLKVSTGTDMLVTSVHIGSTVTTRQQSVWPTAGNVLRCLCVYTT